jgi:hypothetical protein
MEDTGYNLHPPTESAEVVAGQKLSSYSLTISCSTSSEQVCV